jgi:triacylglycerol esterase/lipase EstA (alpha/beta hydrolase family)
MLWICALTLGEVVLAGTLFFLLVTYIRLLAHTRELRRILRAFPVEFAASLWGVALWPLFLVMGGRYQSRTAGPRPVVLLHGYGMNRMSFFWLGRALARRGLGPLVGLNYRSLRPVSASAARLQRFIEAVCAAENVDRVDLVCHSLGGVVARYYATELGGAARIHHIVTVGSPHHGSVTGQFALGRSAAELLPGSAFLAALSMRPPVANITSIYSLADNVIVPPTSSRLDGADNVELPDLGHFALLMSPRVANVIADRLGRAGARQATAPAPPGLALSQGRPL